MQTNSKMFEIAPFQRRIGAWFIDFLIIFIIWYTLTTKDMERVNKLMETLDPDISENLDVLIEEVFDDYSIGHTSNYLMLKIPKKLVKGEIYNEKV